MKEIQLKTVTLTNSTVPKDFTLKYRGEYLRLIEIIPEGITASQMGSLITIAQKLAALPDDGLLLLEDSEAAILAEKLRNAKWNFAAPEIVAMVAAVEHAPAPAPAPAQKKEKGA